MIEHESPFLEERKSNKQAASQALKQRYHLNQFCQAHPYLSTQPVSPPYTLPLATLPLTPSHRGSPKHPLRLPIDQSPHRLLRMLSPDPPFLQTYLCNRRRIHPTRPRQALIPIERRHRGRMALKSRLIHRRILNRHGRTCSRHPQGLHQSWLHHDDSRAA